jgi:hypothetical protein
MITTGNRRCLRSSILQGNWPVCDTRTGRRLHSDGRGDRGWAPLERDHRSGRDADSLQPAEHLSTFGAIPSRLPPRSPTSPCWRMNSCPGRQRARVNTSPDTSRNSRHTLQFIGATRGLGLVNGVELASGQVSAAKQAAEMRRSCRDAGLQVGFGSQASNVLRNTGATRYQRWADRACDRYDRPGAGTRDVIAPHEP